MTSILWLGEPECGDPFVVGGKAASLSRLAERFPVPPGFALTTAVFGNASGTSAVGVGLGIPVLPAAVVDEVAAAYRLLASRCEMDEPPVAVRSSAVDEDGSDASFAGQHETFLNVIGVEALLRSIERCWASFTAPHALEYRRQQGLPVEGVRAAVLVQQLVVADAAAVVFTADPISGSRYTLVVNASWGLGESIVGGTVTPDIYEVARPDLTIERRSIADKRSMTVAVPGGTSEVQVPSALRTRPSLANDQIVAIARLGIALEEATGRPVDVECAYLSNRLYLLQSRPITTLGQAERQHHAPAPVESTATPEIEAGRPAGTTIAPPAEFPVVWEHAEDARLLWTLDRVHWPRPVPPLVFAIAGDALARGLTAAATAYALPIAEVRIRRINTYRYQANVPLDGSAVQAEDRRRRSEERLRAAMGRMRAAWSGEWLPEIQRHLDAWEAFDLAAAPTPALVDHFEETLARACRLWEIHFLLATPMHGAISQFGKLHRELFRGTTLDGYKLLRGASNKIVLGGKSLWYLSRLALALPEVRGVLQGEASGALSALGQTAQGRDFLTELQSYLAEYGQRSESLSLERPSWSEDPSPVIEHLRSLMSQGDRDIVGEMVATWEETERLVTEARRTLAGYPEPVRAEFEFLLAAAQEAVVLSEDHNFWIDARGMYFVRRVFLELGRRLASDGAIEAAEDVFFLTAGEVRETVMALPGVRRHTLVAERRAEMERFRGVTPPAQLGTIPPGDAAQAAQPRASADHGKGGAAEPDMLRGHAGSPGLARGKARVLRSLAEAGKLARGEILVAETLSSSWTPLFATAAGVVTDTGGMLSHAAVVAREYGIPAVLGADGASARLCDGQAIEVDGSQGTIRVLAEDDGP